MLPVWPSALFPFMVCELARIGKILLAPAPRAATFRWNMSPDHLVVPHGGFHLVINVHRVIREVYSWNPNRLIFRALDCVNETVRKSLRYSGSGIDQLDKA